MTKVKIYENKECCVYKDSEDENGYLRFIVPGKLSSRVVETVEPENIEQIRLVREANNLDENLRITEPVPKFEELSPEFFSSKEEALEYASQFIDSISWNDKCKFVMNLPHICYTQKERDYINVCKIIPYGSSSDCPLTPDSLRIHVLDGDHELCKLAERNESEWKKRVEPLNKKHLEEIMEKLKNLGVM